MSVRSIAVLCVSVLGACGGGSSPIATMTGSLVVEQAGCQGISVIRIVDSKGHKDFSLDADCRFTAKVQANQSVYAQFLDASSELVALLAWDDPTALNDGKTIKLTSFLRLGAGDVHDLDGITVVDVDASLVGYVGSAPAFHGTGGTRSAIPIRPPIGFDTDKSGFPDENEIGYQTGTDTTGDGVPEVDAPSGCTPGQGPLFGRINVKLVRDDIDPAELTVLQDNAATLPPEVTLTTTGFTMGPVASSGAWILLGDASNDSAMYMADEAGNFEIKESPAGVSVAKVYLSPGDEQPFMYLPQCMLQATAGAVSDTNAIEQARVYPNPCHMNSGVWTTTARSASHGNLTISRSTCPTWAPPALSMCKPTAVPTKVGRFLDWCSVDSCLASTAS